MPELREPQGIATWSSANVQYARPPREVLLDEMAVYREFQCAARGLEPRPLPFAEGGVVLSDFVHTSTLGLQAYGGCAV